jgi:hypothetical protein
MNLFSVNMNLNSYTQRSKFIKRIIFWSVLIGALLALFFSSTSTGAFAQPIDVCQTFNNCLPGVQENKTEGAQGIVKFVMQVVWFLIFISTAIAVLFIVWGALLMITSAGSEDGYKKGIETLRNAVVGLVLGILSMTIVFVISSVVPSINIFT